MRPLARASAEEVNDLNGVQDFRLPQYRREVFLRFYEFHLENRAHPGGVYFAMPWLARKYGMDDEAKLWMAFLNGNTQNIVTTMMLFKRFPTINSPGLEAWFTEKYKLLAWDTDRRYHRKDFLKSVDCYRRLTGGQQREYFRSLEGPSQEDTFARAWKALRDDFYTFGRLSSFSYAEYLRLNGIPLQCNTLFLDDMSGSKSHRNGLAKVLGRDDLDWHKDHGFDGEYQDGEVEWLGVEAEQLLTEARERTARNQQVDPTQVNYFTLESAFCTYKSWHRKNRRYANVYNDMFHDRIKLAAERFGDEEVKEFWDCREDCLPKHLRLECCPNDPGLCPEKQNYYRETGKPIMMSKRWPEFDNDFDRRIWQ